MQQPFSGVRCSRQPIKYLNNKKFKCVSKVTKESCLRNSNFNIQNYLIQYENGTSVGLNLPYLIGNLSSMNIVLTSLNIEQKHDVYHQLKFNMGRTLFTNNTDVFLKWYGTLLPVVRTSRTVHVNSDFFDEINLPQNISENHSLFNSDSINPKPILRAPAEPSVISHADMTPSFDERRSMCNNVVISTQHVFRWRADTMPGVDIHVVLGSVPVRVPDSLLTQSTGTDKNEKLSSTVKTEVSLLQKHKIVFKHESIQIDNFDFDLNDDVGNSSEVGSGISDPHSNATESNETSSTNSTLDAYLSSTDSSSSKILLMIDNSTNLMENETISDPENFTQNSSLYNDESTGVPINLTFIPLFNQSVPTDVSPMKDSAENLNVTDRARIPGYILGVPLRVGYYRLDEY